MKTIPVLFTAVFLLIGFSAGTAVADDHGPEVQAMSNPSVTLNVTANAFYNLTFLGIGIKSPSGVYDSPFSENHWVFKRANNTTDFYTSNVNLVRTGMSGPIQDSAVPYDTQVSGVDRIGATVKITLEALGYSLSNVTIYNGNLSQGNYYFPDYSVLELTVSIVLAKAIAGPGTVFLYQLIKSSNSSISAKNYFLGNLTHRLDDRMNGEHHGMLINGSNAKSAISAFYWWDNTFKLNGVPENLTSNIGVRDGGIYIVFAFPFNSSLKSIYQDPFIGVPNTPLFKSPIIHKELGVIVNYVIVHAEFLGTGVASGIGLLGISYSIYRRRKL